MGQNLIYRTFPRATDLKLVSDQGNVVTACPLQKEIQHYTKLKSDVRRFGHCGDGGKMHHFSIFRNVYFSHKKCPESVLKMFFSSRLQFFLTFWDIFTIFHFSHYFGFRDPTEITVFCCA